MSNPIIKTDLFSRMAHLEVGSVEKNYKGLAIHALQGLHEHIGTLVKELFPQPSSLLDIAAGSGALTLRLQDIGHKMAACDYVADNFRLMNTVDFTQVDLNKNFSKRFNTLFDGILAIEIIEHIENPRHVIREIFASLAPGGKLILSTPNIDNPVSLALFVRFGCFQWFAEENYQNDGHITPISQYSMRTFLEESGFVDIEISSFGDPFRVTQGWPKIRLLAKVLGFLSAIDNRSQGEILVVNARKPG
ncbi:3-demethylubiquinone-9 3-methyltransferase [Crenothrix polyspora]|uniref:3-demethylubiquinone-9 3-methyltransferase n=1 Tax=Crenothrix polyspora TaxID=360316 RepID=A0A1R4HIX9_9GAMM|nr:class I SAM-dependent methyltransferase [Crenothrix polyspora]SJM96173.1 3-demethylubiquinone-9 3-methyltransferase [Crenothrix polyspora]